MSDVQGVILDVDGTLVDSNDAHARAWVEALAEHGHHVAFDEVRRMIGMGGDKLLPRATGIEEDTPEGKALSARRSEIFRERYLPSLSAFPKVRELLSAMRARGLSLVVASSAKAEELKPLLRVAHVEDLIEEKTSSKDVENSKPDPDIVQTALRRGGIAADRAVMLGDTPYDVQSALRAGVAAVALRCGGWHDADLAGAAAVYDDAADLLAHFAQSPFVRGR